MDAAQKKRNMCMKYRSRLQQDGGSWEQWMDVNKAKLTTTQLTKIAYATSKKLRKTAGRRSEGRSSSGVSGEREV